MEGASSYATGALKAWGDGVEDAAVVLKTNTAGTTGKFYDLATVINQNGSPNVAATEFPGA